MASRFLPADSLNMSWRQERSGYSCVPEFHFSMSFTDSSLDLVASLHKTPSTTWTSQDREKETEKVNANGTFKSNVGRFSSNLFYFESGLPSGFVIKSRVQRKQPFIVVYIHK